MRAHWDSWVTEDHIKALADRNVEVVRLPIGDWTTTSYGPYIGCMDGAAEKIEWFLDTAATYGLKVLLDVHALKDSQNGFDNSGQALNVVWDDESNFRHWSIEAANWMGEWNGYEYVSINYDNINWGINNVIALMERWGSHPALYALEPVNEPWWSSDEDVLKQYYVDCRNAVRNVNPDTIFVFHDSFIPWSDFWNNLFPDNDMANVIVDTHQYMAWWERKEHIGLYCDDYGANLRNWGIADFKYPVWVGEWSLATDVCAMWLGGFNDSNTEYQFPCQKVDCPYSYMPAPYNVDFDRTAPGPLGPFGESKRSTIEYGQCYTDSAFFSDADVKVLGDCISYIFDDTVAGQFLWNFRTELEPRWSYIEAYDNGWINAYYTEFMQ